MSQQNAFGCNFQLKMKIQLKFFQQYLNTIVHNLMNFFPNTMVYTCSITANHIGTNRWYYESWYVL